MRGLKSASELVGVAASVSSAAVWPRVGHRACHLHPFAFRYISRIRRRSRYHQFSGGRCVRERRGDLRRSGLCPIQHHIDERLSLRQPFSHTARPHRGPGSASVI